MSILKGSVTLSRFKIEDIPNNIPGRLKQFAFMPIDDIPEERAAKVIRIYNTAKAPYWNVMIERDGAPFSLYSADPKELRPAYVDNE